MNESVDITDPQQPGIGATLRAYAQLTKPRIIGLLLGTTLPAMILATRGWPGWWLVAATLIGGALSAAGANAINQVWDADIDRLMNRTRERPLPTESMGPRAAMIFGVALGIIGFVWLLATTNLLAASLSTVGLLFYVFVYTMLLKRSTTQNIVIGGAAGAVPPLVGWAAVTGSLAAPAWILFAMVFFWTPTHFWALAIRYKDDYKAAGVPMLPGVVGIKMTADHILFHSFVTVGAALFLIPWTGWIYFAGVVVLGSWLIAGAFHLRSHLDTAMRYFKATNGYLGGVFLAVAIDVLVLDQFGVSDVIDEAALVVASILVVGGMLAIVAREFGTHPERRLVGRVRDAVEVLLPFAGAVALVLATWTSVP
ncbi:MAG: heme o synthase [Actinomycetota bacterium]|nr:heme o synthase [Actinomycetota bacterium]